MTATAGPATFKLHHISQDQSANISILSMRHMAGKAHVCKKYLKHNCVYHLIVLNLCLTMIPWCSLSLGQSILPETAPKLPFHTQILTSASSPVPHWVNKTNAIKPCSTGECEGGVQRGTETKGWIPWDHQSPRTEEEILSSSLSPTGYHEGSQHGKVHLMHGPEQPQDTRDVPTSEILALHSAVSWKGGASTCKSQELLLPELQEL